MKVIAINGSPNLGYTNYMVDQALNELVSRGIECEKIILNDLKMELCLGCPDCRDREVCAIQDDVTEVLEKYRTADGVILSSPVWFHSINSHMKAFLDRTIFLNRHNTLPVAKVAGLLTMAGRSGADTAMEEMVKFFTDQHKKPYSGSKIIQLVTYHGGPGNKPEDMTEVIEQSRNMGKEMADILLGKSS
jgi:multimeric flavodoxin WrbA